VGWEKVACWSTKAAIGLISEKRSDRGKVTMECLQEVINALSIFWVAVIFLLPVSPLRATETAVFALFLPVQPSNRYQMVQMDVLAANHVHIVGLCGQNKAHCAVIFAISQLSC